MNPFPKPHPTQSDTQVVIDWVNDRIKSPGGLHFHDCIYKVKEFVEKGDREMALVAAHYTVNILNKSNCMSDIDKNVIVAELSEQIEKMK
jgi:hypothetical protein